MAILTECPFCRRRQSNRNRLCACGEDLVKAKRSNRVKYWITYRLPGGKQRREPVGFSVEEARAAEGKRKSQKKEGRIFDMLPQSKMTFRELAKWYLDLTSVKRLSSYDRVRQGINNFNAILGDHKLNEIKPVDLENYQGRREEHGVAPATIDMEVSIVKTMVTKAFDNDMVDGRALKPFRCVKRKLKSGANARKRTISVQEYLNLLKAAPQHLKPILIVAYNTGMRSGELRGLKWAYIDRQKGFIRLSADATKEGKAKVVPINHHVQDVLDNTLRAIHHDYVFTYKGGPIKTPGGLRNSFRTACIKAGMIHGRDEQDGVTFHDIRRTVKTNMLTAGVDKAHRDVILGHSLRGMDVHYLAPSEETLRQAMDRFTKWLDSQLDSANVDQTVDQEAKRG